MKDVIFNVRSQKAYDSLMEQLDDKGYEWITGKRCSYADKWYLEGRKMIIFLKHEYGKRILYGNLEDEEGSKVTVFKPKDKLENYLTQEEN